MFKYSIVVHIKKRYIQIGIQLIKILHGVVHISEVSDLMICTKCRKTIKNVIKNEVPKCDWGTWICSECDDNFYGQRFINWIEDRISPSTSDDPTGNFVLRELVQNADDVESNIIILKFCEDALYVYNDGFSFRSSTVDTLGDFDRISMVLAKPKENDYYTSGNFGSGFQTVYLFTNYPEVHSSGKSFRYDPTVPQKDSLLEENALKSPYINSDDKKGVIFRFPWRTEENAIIIDGKGHRSFEKKEIWRRWNQKSREDLYNEFRVYLHDSLICCQHLKKIRLIWDSDTRKGAYQAERDFTLEFIQNDGQIRSVMEGEGKGGLLSDDWEYYNVKEFKYLIGSSFVHDIDSRKSNIYLIVSDKKTKDELEVKSFVDNRYNPESFSYPEYCRFLDEKQAVKKSDVHILLPIFPWEERSPNYERKAWSYSVIPLPKESGNNFTMTAHLFPKQTRESFEGHLDKAKKEWLEKVLLSAAKLYLRTYSQFVNEVRRSNFENDIKQKIMLDYLPEMKLGRWVNVSLENTDAEEKIENDFVIKVFSKGILLFRNKWFSPFRYDSSKNGLDSLTENVAHPRDDTERLLLQKMDMVTFTKEFVEHHRFKELEDLKKILNDKMIMDDVKFIREYGMFAQKLKNKDLFIYGKGPLDHSFVKNLVNHCLSQDKTSEIKLLPIVPNKEGKMSVPKKLKKEPEEEFSVLADILPSDIYPHPDFSSMVKGHLESFTNPSNLLDGMKENKDALERDIETLRICYKWLENSEMKLPGNINEYSIVLSESGNLLKIDEVYWVPTEHHDTICNIIDSVGYDVNIVSKQVFSEFADFISNTFQVKMLDYAVFVENYLSFIEGKDETHKQIQSIIAEGILLYIESKQHLSDGDKDFYSKLPFLPVKGKLDPPYNVCIGKQESEEIDIFLGIIDEHVQKLILANDTFVDILKGLGMGNLQTDPVAWIVDQIDIFANNNEDIEGLCYLDGQDHKVVSRCLEIISEQKNISQNTSIMSKKILPVSYHGKVILSTLPRWDTKEGERRTEKYERDWPWVLPKPEHLEIGAKLLWDEIKFIRLSNGFEKAQEKIISEFNLERLIAAQKDGIPRNLFLYFLAPKEDEKSLFFENNIKDFFKNTISELEIDKLKRTFLNYVQSYYEKSDHSAETKMNIRDKPCLYDPEGVWRFPVDFAFSIDEDMENIGYHQLSPDFSESNGWNRQTLTNIGVVDEIEFSKLEKLLRSAQTGPVNSESSKQILKALLLGMDEDIGSDEDWEMLSVVPWIPRMNSTWGKPMDSMPPLDSIVDIIGSDYPSLMDISCLKEEEKKKILEHEIVDFNHVGFRTEPTSEEMMSIWRDCQQNDIEPPSSLFDGLEGDFEEWSPKFGQIIDKLKYFYGDRWVDPKIVFMDKKALIPEPMARIFVFSNEHEKLLKWLRHETDIEESPRIKAQDALNIMENLMREDMILVWEFIVEHGSDINADLSLNYKDKSIIPINDKVFIPGNIIVPEDSKSTMFSLRGTIGDKYILDDKVSSKERDVLLKLGAKPLEDALMDKGDLEYLLDFIAGQNPVKGMDLWHDYVKLLDIFISKINGFPSNVSFIPIKKNGTVTFKTPNEVIIADRFKIWKHFEDENRLNFFDEDIFSDDNINIEGFTGWIVDCGSKRLDNLLKKDEPTGQNAEVDVYLTKDLAHAIESVKQIVSRAFEPLDLNKIEPMIEALQGSTVYICKDITRSYSVDMSIIDGGQSIFRKVKGNHYYDEQQKSFFIDYSGNCGLETIKEIIINEFDPGFEDRYRKVFWRNAIEQAFEENDFTDYDDDSYPIYEPVRRSLPDLQENLQMIDDWWKGYLSSEDAKASFPTLDGDFWWPALGLKENGDGLSRESLIKEGLFSDRKLMFNIFSMATMLGSNVNRNQIRNYLKILDNNGLSFSYIYDMSEEDVIKQLIDIALGSGTPSSIQEKHYPDVRRRILDILIIRRALKDDVLGGNLLSMLKAHMEDGLSPEEFLATGHAYDNRPLMRGFKGMFTGQIYFIVREAVRLELSDSWSEIAFHSPTQVRTLIDNIGGNVVPPSNPSGREEFARYMIKEISSHEAISDWYDIPFFIYYDEHCRNCTNGYVSGKECPLLCYRKR